MAKINHLSNKKVTVSADVSKVMSQIELLRSSTVRIRSQIMVSTPFDQTSGKKDLSPVLIETNQNASNRQRDEKLNKAKLETKLREQESLLNRLKEMFQGFVAVLKSEELSNNSNDNNVEDEGEGEESLEQDREQGTVAKNDQQNKDPGRYTNRQV